MQSPSRGCHLEVSLEIRSALRGRKLLAAYDLPKRTQIAVLRFSSLVEMTEACTVA